MQGSRFLPWWIYFYCEVEVNPSGHHIRCFLQRLTSKISRTLRCTRDRRRRDNDRRFGEAICAKRVSLYSVHSDEQREGGKQGKETRAKQVMPTCRERRRSRTEQSTAPRLGTSRDEKINVGSNDHPSPPSVLHAFCFIRDSR